MHITLIQNRENGRWVKSISQEGPIRLVETTKDMQQALRPTADQLIMLCDLDVFGLPYPPLGKHRPQYVQKKVEVPA